MGQPWRYQLREVLPHQLAEVLEELKGPDLLGINLTVPLKEAAFALVAGLTEPAREVGAINCLRWTEQGWEGHNTDALGWLDSWDEEIGEDLVGRKVVLLGAGGAARAVLQALRSRQVGPLTLLNRTAARARALLLPGEELREWSEAAFHEELQPGCLVVQTTTLGMWPHQQQQPLAWPKDLPPGVVACDLIYNPSPTHWLAQAGQKGARTLDGCGMLVHQAARAIHWWSGLRPESQVLHLALRDSLK